MKTRIEYQGRAGFVYHKGKEHINIDSEMLLGGDDNTPNMMIAYNTIKYWISTNSKRLVSNVERKEIIKNLEISCGAPDKIEWDMHSHQNWDGGWER